ncbi:FAD-binding oxidoreductase [Okeania sp.]|uniref:FAD-binding oxidoreductase n=1 Tax=Okeania sp. TaxID=3100323 RepID=UPI002B4AF304|nr:FAD-binding oxidoreductase [Okeania sp.]MEB3340536.1 FAD-binding oxidoreductase [Okeania sp.]
MTTTNTKEINWDALTSELTNIEIITEPNQVIKLSLDYYHFSPILESKLKDKKANLIVRPSNEAEVLQIAQTCVKYQAPLTIRGAGTGNYGQCIPLAGGVVLDTTKMNNINWIKPGLSCVEPGVKLVNLDKKAREIGWEIRMFPSTYRTATIGGFIGGGSSGIGSINYGGLRDRGNVSAVRVVTMEDEPRVLELRGDEVQKVNHAYGTNGIITQLEIPLAPTYPWAELIVAFDDFMTCAKFAQALGDSDGIVKKLITIFAWPIPSFFVGLKSSIIEGKHCAFLMISEYSLASFQDLVKEFNGEICYEKTAQEASKSTPIYEFTWNHTTLHARSVDTNLTYLQSGFPTDRNLALVEKMYRYFGDEVIMHLEFVRMNGTTTPVGLQIVRYSSEERLNEIIEDHEKNGVNIFNPHTYILEDGGMKTTDIEQLEFKQKVDPYGLLNPGKMKGWINNG